MSTEKTAYLDYNATTPLKPAVRESMLEILGFPGNASSVHKSGREARRLIEESRQTIAKWLNAGPKDVIVFTSGATEANNMALRGCCIERVLVSAIEHPSVLYARPDREIIPVLPSGIIDLAALEKMLEGNTKQTLISVMMVNNESGVIQPVEQVVALAKKYGALVHSDAVQATGRLPIDLQQLGIDFFTLSGHKMGGPQGIGCLIIRNCNTVAPLLCGGGQEKSLRAGTENLAGIVGLGKAAAAVDLDTYKKLSVLRDKIENALTDVAPKLKIFGKDAPRVANTILFATPGLASDMQLIGLDLAGICVSSGSACSSGSAKPSHVLAAMGASDAEMSSYLRISLGWGTTEQDADYFIEKWTEIYRRSASKSNAA